MLPWVISHPGATVAEVCDRFGYTPTSLMKDLNLVFLCGLPGYGPGDLMVAYVDDEEVVVDMAEYFSRPFRLTYAEALDLLASGLTLLNAGEGTPALARAVQKVTAVMNIPDEEALGVVIEVEPDLVHSLRMAAAEGRVVHLTYTSMGAGRTSERDVEPWSVFTTLGNWYLHGFCRAAREERIFRVDRIRDLAETDERFEVPAERPVPHVGYVPSDGDVSAVIRLRPPARWVVEYYPVTIVREDPLEIRFSASDPAIIARLLLRLGPDAELLEGAQVREALDDVRRRVAARYR